MSAESLMKCAHHLSVSVEALAALGAALQLQRHKAEADPCVVARLQEVLRAIDPQLFENGFENRADYALPLIETVFRQATELFQNPERAPGWRHEDPVLLQSQSKVSRLIAHSIDELTFQKAEMRAAVRGPGAFLDVGTGAGWLALEVARIWPNMCVVGIDIWEPALALARKNIADSEYGAQVELRLQRIEDLDEPTRYTMAWFPGSFIPAEITGHALERIHNALIPGGWLLFAIWAPSANPLETAVANLRIVRSGGHPWIAQEVESCLFAAGYTGIESLPPGVPGSPIAFVIGQRPR